MPWQRPWKAEAKSAFMYLHPCHRPVFGGSSSPVAHGVHERPYGVLLPSLPDPQDPAVIRIDNDGRHLIAVVLFPLVYAGL